MTIINHKRNDNKNLKPKRSYKPYTKFIFDFLKEEDSPSWFRALSGLQLRACDSLLKTLRDDYHQETTYRTRITLQTIGIEPVESPKNIRLAMKLSRESDLAFIWYLFELYYAKPDALSNQNYEYNINEQLLLTTLAHLDMITTMRGLDRVLPPQRKKIQQRKKTNERKVEKIYSSPYLAPLVDPKPPKKKTCFSKYKRLSKVSPYECYADPNYFVPNELKRWFATDKTVLKSKSVEAKSSAANIVTRILNNEIRNLFAKQSKIHPTGGSLCLKHKILEEQRKNLMTELRVETRKKCINYFTNEYKNEEFKLRFEQRLEKDLVQIDINLKKLTERYKTETWMRLLVHELIDKNTDFADVQLCSKIDSCSVDTSAFDSILDKERSAYLGLVENGCKDDTKAKVKTEVTNAFDYGHFGIPKKDELYFTANYGNKPYKFDYLKIYKENDNAADSKEEMIVKTVRKCIRQNLDDDNIKDDDQALDKCFEKLWFNEVIKSNNKAKKIEKKEILKSPYKTHLAKRQRSIYCPKSNNELAPSVKKSKYEGTYYNPKDHQLMVQMVRDGLEILNEDPKYVLAALPDAYKLPPLIAFAKKRYGYVSTKRELVESLKKTKKVIFEMRRIGCTAPLDLVPQIREMGFGKRNFISYRLKGCLQKRVQQVREKCHEYIRKRLLEDTRIYWLTMGPSHCSAGPPRDVFYSYLPGRLRDITPLKPWRSNDYRNINIFWNRKQILKKLAEEDYK